MLAIVAAHTLLLIFLPMYSQKDALNLLLDYQPADSSEHDAKSFITEFIEQNALYWSRSTLAGHLTASAWVTDERHQEAVLLHHKKLDIWVQPGGHIDDQDESLISASLREAEEETGLAGLVLAQPGVFDLDVHAIPARKQEPEHLHLDVRFWFIAKNKTLTISEESNELEWMARADIEAKTDEESVLRMVRKTLL